MASERDAPERGKCDGGPCARLGHELDATAFVMIRAVSFTHVDALLKLPVGAFRLNHLLENGGPLLIALNALALLARRPPAPPLAVPPDQPPDPSLVDHAGPGRRVR